MFICRNEVSLDVKTIWPAGSFELNLLKFSHFVSNSLRNAKKLCVKVSVLTSRATELGKKSIFGVFFGKIIFLTHFKKNPRWPSFSYIRLKFFCLSHKSVK